MRILIKRDTRWEALSPMDYTDEDELQELLKQGSTDLIPSDRTAGDTHVVFAREVATDSGPVDLVGIGSSGSITVMECKLARNRQIKREVVGQVLDYAAALWETDPETFIANFAQVAGSDPFAVLRERVVSGGAGWDEDLCRSEVARRIRDGDFRLLIAVDSIDADLRRIIRFVNSRGTGSSHLQLVALAFPRYRHPPRTEVPPVGAQHDTTPGDEHGAIQILIPETFGDEISPPGPTPERREWNDAVFFRALGPNGEEQVRLASEFRDWAKSRGYEVGYGGGQVEGWMGILVGHGDPNRTLVLIGAGRVGVVASIGFTFGRLRSTPPFDQQSAREELVGRFAAVFDREIKPTQADTAAYVPITRLSDPLVFARFKAEVENAMARVASESEATPAPPV